MDKNSFWSIDKLIPSISGSASFGFEKKSKGVLIQNLNPGESSIQFGPVISPKESRVIRYYQLSEIKDPCHDALLKQADTSFEKDLPFVPCSLFSPTFLSLSGRQRNYFIFFCYCSAKQKKIPISFPYLQLYICRCIRIHLVCGELPEDFFWVWKSYRKDFPLVDKLFSDSVCDFYFITKAPLPYSKLADLVVQPDFTTRPFLLDPFFFDYLFREDRSLTKVEGDLVLRHLTGESFRKSKAYRMHPTFRTASEDAVFSAMQQGLFNRRDLNECLFRIQIPSEVRVERDLFPGLPKGEVPEGKISLCYVPLLHDENIRSRFDEIIRYLENRIRKILKMKNSLSRIHISSEHRTFLEGILMGYEHLSPLENEDNRTSKAEDHDRTEQHHEKRSLEINIEAAAKIEENSWALTQLLTETYSQESVDAVLIGAQENADESFDRRYENEFKQLSSVKRETGENEFWEFASALTEIEDSFMRIALHAGKEDARRFCLTNGMFFEAVIASCNAKALETVEDSIFDGAGSIYEDYTESLVTVFPPMEGK